MLGDIQPGDESDHAIVHVCVDGKCVCARGGVQVFVDIRPDTLNLDERAIAAAASPRTRAIVAVHYAGVPCEMDEIVALAAGQPAGHRRCGTGRGRPTKNRPAGRLGDLAATSFHETKNVTSGEGGALLVDSAGSRRAPKSSATRGPTAAGFCVARSTSTRGSTWALPSCRASSPPPSYGTDGSRGGDRRATSGNLVVLLRGVRRARQQGGCDGPSSRTTAATTPTCST